MTDSKISQLTDGGNAQATDELVAVRAGANVRVNFGKMQLDNGASGAGNLAMAFTSDTDTGFYRPAANTLAIQTGGVDRMRIDSGGRWLKGIDTVSAGIASATPEVQIHTTVTGNQGIAAYNWSDGNAGATYHSLKSRGGVIGTQAVVVNGDAVLQHRSGASDGTNFIEGARCEIRVDAVPSTGNVRMRYLWMTRNAAGTLAERMRLTSDGTFAVGTTSPNANAIADFSSTTKAFMPPRMTTTQKNAIAAPTAGMVVYDTTLNKLSVRTASAWETVQSV